MGTEVENAAVSIQNTVTTPHSTASTSGPKTSMFAKKSGFVIPKNKLLGSLVPVVRGTKKGDGDSVKEDATIQVQRKTKWGPDLALDTYVRKARILAYQTRINQISQQLTLGGLEIEDNQDTLSTSEFHDGKSSDQQFSTEISEQLGLESREIIGEILKLNPSYKAPADYKPILKEAKVPIPIKEYPGYNFIGLVFGLASDTQKRLEKETGAKIRVYGTKANTGGKFEITTSDGKETESAYDDIYVHVSADTFEKVDAAVALIELLVTPVSGNPMSSASSTSVTDVNMNIQPSQTTSSSIVAPLQGQIPQYPQPWLYPQSGLLNPAVSSAPLLSNPVQVSSLPFQPSNPSLFGPRPVMAPSFSSVWENPSLLHSRPQQQHSLHSPHMQQAPLLSQIGGPRNYLGPPQNVRPFMPPLPQPSTFESTRWPQSSMSTSSSNFMPMTQPMGAPRLNVPNNMITPLSGIPQSSGSPASQQFQAASAPMSFQQSSLSGVIPRPQQPSSGDFTFQPHRPPNAAASQMAWQSGQHTTHPQTQSGQAPLTPQPSLMRPVIHNLNSSPVFSRPHMNQQPMHQIVNFAGNSIGHPPPPPPRHPAVAGHNFVPPHHMNNSAGPFSPRPGSQMHFGANRPQMFPAPHQHFGNHPLRPFGNSSGGQQTYDPFSPTSTSFNPRMSGNAANLQNENDPEYEDLMASVGVQ